MARKTTPKNPFPFQTSDGLSFGWTLKGGFAYEPTAYRAKVEAILSAHPAQDGEKTLGMTIPWLGMPTTPTTAAGRAALREWQNALRAESEALTVEARTKAEAKAAAARARRAAGPRRGDVHMRLHADGTATVQLL